LRSTFTATFGFGGFLLQIMAKIVFRLAGVGDDEAQDVRTLLQEAGIEFYETSAGRWQISLAALWLRHDDDFQRARALIDAYQDERRVRLQSQAPAAQSFWQFTRSRPLDSFFILLAIAVIIALMLWPFLNLIKKGG
jgi:hypothetical protein